MARTWLGRAVGIAFASFVTLWFLVPAITALLRGDVSGFAFGLLVGGLFYGLAWVIVVASIRTRVDGDERGITLCNGFRTGEIAWSDVSALVLPPVYLWWGRLVGVTTGGEVVDRGRARWSGADERRAFGGRRALAALRELEVLRARCGTGRGRP